MANIEDKQREDIIKTLMSRKGMTREDAVAKVNDHFAKKAAEAAGAAEAAKTTEAPVVAVSEPVTKPPVAEAPAVAKAPAVAGKRTDCWFVADADMIAAIDAKCKETGMSRAGYFKSLVKKDTGLV